MLNMKLCGDLILREKCAPVDGVSLDVLSAMDDMVEKMHDQNGVGMAAPQVGILSRFLVMMNPDTKEIFRMINPKIVSKSDKICRLEEGCLSILGNDNMPIFSMVERPESVAVEWTDETGTVRRAEMSGLAARVIQHEADHLDGILFIDYLSPIKREQVMRKVKKYKK